MKPTIGAVVVAIAMMVTAALSFSAGWLIARTARWPLLQSTSAVPLHNAFDGASARTNAGALASYDLTQRYTIKTASSPYLGRKEAAITIVEFMDFECPFCAQVVPTLRKLSQNHPGAIRIVFKNNPLSIHSNSMDLHRAALAAADQGKFWEMYDLIFSSHKKLEADDVKRFAAQLGLRLNRFNEVISSEEVSTTIAEDREEASRLGIRGTATLFINGYRVSGAQPYHVLESVLEDVTKLSADSRNAPQPNLLGRVR
jgi:protein-disulfide isomerase